MLQAPQVQRPDLLDLIDKSALAERLGVTVRGLNKMIARKVLPRPFHVGRRAYWRKPTLVAFFEGCEKRPT
jgi:hypothetical protein